MRIVVCDDNRLLLEALSNALARQGFTIEAATSAPGEAIDAVKLYDPDILLIDLGFPAGAEGLTAAREVARSHPRTRVVIITGGDDPAPLLEAMRIGVAGYVRKDQRLEGIVSALRQAANGESAIDKALLRRLTSASRDDSRRSAVARLTQQERVVLGYLADGLQTSEIVSRLGISTSTVRSHIQAILSKLGVHTRLQAVAVFNETDQTPRAVGE
jgi:two-component system nitrate/nitrite response regulator NarL